MTPEIFVSNDVDTDNFPHIHRALDAAIEQGAVFCNTLKEILESKS